ncbi:MFS transporter [Penicillium angulare]|uniref:MFS transporter n=1 Tax=Penicillium angulare TaxID=116970 RepID=UPI002540DA09|nr:MFS transporter [Penicillium angulare]KAJ5259409.1 MFS transporter [Penicillium angulare]
MPRQPHDALTTAEKALHDQTNLLPSRQLIFCLCILSLGQLISFIDQNGISTALPTIAADLNAGDTISWAGTASLLANTTCQMLYGRASDIFGRKTVLISAVLLLAIGDLVCGLSTSAAMFYVFRGVAGIGSGGITNLTMIILSDVVTLEQRGKYQGIVGSMIGLGSVTGPFFSAAFVSRATWRGFFWMLAPLGALNALLAFFYLPSKPPKTTFKVGVKDIDYLGALTSSIASILLLIPISGGGSYFSWDSPLVISMLVIGTVALVIFLISQWKLSKLPMMPRAVYQSTVYYIPLYLLNAHGLTVFASAAIFASLAGIQAVMSAGSGFFISHFKKYGIVIRFGFAMWTLSTSPGVLVVCLLVIGIGVGCVFQPTLVALQSHSVKERRAVIISARNFNRSAGGACGLAISAATLQARLRSSLPPNLLYLAKSSYSLPNLKGGVPTAVLDAYMAASHMVFIVQVPLIATCFLGSILLRDRGLIPVGTQAVQTSLTERGDQREVLPDTIGEQNIKKA